MPRSKTGTNGAEKQSLMRSAQPNCATISADMSSNSTQPLASNSYHATIGSVTCLLIMYIPSYEKSST